MNVVAANKATNSQLSSGKGKNTGVGHDRHEKLQACLTKNQNVLSEKDAMKPLEDVSITCNGEWETEWSVVHNLDAFSATICKDMRYNAPHTFTRK